jgi:hypothetical protein
MSMIYYKNAITGGVAATETPPENFILPQGMQMSTYEEFETFWEAEEVRNKERISIRRETHKSQWIADAQFVYEWDYDKASIAYELHH